MKKNNEIIAHQYKIILETKEEKMGRKLIILLLCLITALSCKKKTDPGIWKTEIINGVKHIYNPVEPAKGSIRLKVKEIKRIDSGSIKTEDVVSFSTFQYDKTGCCYILDSRQVKIYKFDTKGNYLTTFLSKGEGPGEFKSVPRIQVFDSIICTSSEKLAKFDYSGELLEEKKLHISEFGYSDCKFVDKQKFIGQYTEYRGSGINRNRKTVIALFDEFETNLLKFAESDKTGSIRITGGEVTVFFSHHALVPRMVFALGLDKTHLFIAENDEYRIEVKDLKGELKLIIQKEHRNLTITEADKDEAMRMFTKDPVHVKKIIRDNLPRRTCAIYSINMLPKGFIGIKRITGVDLDDIEIDIFSSDGKYIYLVLPSQELSDLSRLVFWEDKVAMVKEINDRDVLIEYKVINLPEIFGL